MIKQLAAGIAVSIATLGATPATALPTPQSLPTIVVGAPSAKLTLQVARTEEQREFGLMYVTALPPQTGMIFVFAHDGPEDFWMKDTLIPLDMVFVGPAGVVRSVAADVPIVSVTTPDDQIPHRDGTAKYVLELPAGEAMKDGIVRGAVLTNLPH